MGSWIRITVENIGIYHTMLTDGEEQVDVVGAHVVLGQVDDGALEGHLAVVVGGHLENSNIRKSSREIKRNHVLDTKKPKENYPKPKVVEKYSFVQNQSCGPGSKIDLYSGPLWIRIQIGKYRSRIN